MVFEEQRGVRGTAWCSKNSVVLEEQRGARGAAWCSRISVVFEARDVRGHRVV